MAYSILLLLDLDVLLLLGLDLGLTRLEGGGEVATPLG